MKELNAKNWKELVLNREALNDMLETAKTHRTL
jgi:hypothetical protein